MTVTPVTLYGHDPSPFVRRVRILLTELGVPFERDTHGWVDPTPEFLAASPVQMVPMLDRGVGARTRYVFDSRVIAEVAYDLTAKTTTAPDAKADPPVQSTLWNAELAEDDKNVFTVIDGALDSAVNLFCIEKDGTVKRAQAPYLQRQERRIESCVDWLERRYAGRRTLTEGKLAYVDISLVAMLGWMRFRKITDVEARKSLVAVENAFADRPSFASTKPG